MFEYPFFENEVRDGFFIDSEMKRAWAAQIALMLDIDRICKENNLIYFLDFGTLLGAVRHKGFIPWDDDMDIGMPKKDYVKFGEIVKKEWSDEYTILTLKDNSDANAYMYRMINKDCISLNEHHLSKFYGFPYIVGMDIFPYDYLPKDSDSLKKDLDFMMKELVDINKEKNFNKMMSKIKKVEQLTGRLFDKDNKIKTEWGLCYEKLIEDRTKEETDIMCYIPSWQKKESKKIQASWIKDIQEVEFEGFQFKALVNAHKQLEGEYGDYSILYRDKNGHAYPFYDKQQNVIEKYSGSKFRRYVFSEEDLIREKIVEEIDKTQNIKDIYELMIKANDLVKQLFVNEAFEKVFEILEKTQENAINLGNVVEYSRLKCRIDIISKINKYCDNIYWIDSWLSGTDVDIESLLFNNDELIKDLGVLINVGSSNKNRVAFVLDKASNWKYVEAIYNRKLAEGNELFVIPVPFYEIGSNLLPGNSHLEADMFPNDIYLMDYRGFDLNSAIFDEIYYCNSFENYDFGSLIEPKFFSKKLQKYAKKIVYVQNFVIDEFSEDEGRALYMRSRYTRTPGVVNADEILVFSEQQKKHYIDELTLMAGENYREMWSNKIVVDTTINPGCKRD